MAEYVPTDAQVRESFIYAQLAVRKLPVTSIGAQYGSEFDRWLAKHDEQTRADERDEWASHFDVIESTFVPDNSKTDFAAHEVSEMLRGPRPFGVAASDFGTPN